MQPPLRHPCPRGGGGASDASDLPLLLSAFGAMRPEHTTGHKAASVKGVAPRSGMRGTDPDSRWRRSVVSDQRIE